MDIEKLDVFKLSHDLTKEIYSLTKSFPKEEWIYVNILDTFFRILSNSFFEFFRTQITKLAVASPPIIP